MRLGRVAPLGVFVGLLMAACGGGDDDKPAAVQQCEDFAELWCNATMNCLVSLGTISEADRTANQGQCIDVAIAAVPCKKAISVTSGYSQCMTDTRTMDCSRWAVPIDQLSTVKPPTTCQGVVLISP
ncbi:MAG: hypothetical protein ACOY0T_07110 [Myxococcota bacterium]